MLIAIPGRPPNHVSIVYKSDVTSSHFNKAKSLTFTISRYCRLEYAGYDIAGNQLHG